MRSVFFALLAASFFVSCNDNVTVPEKDESIVKDVTKPPASEFADPMYVDMGKKMLKQFEGGDIDGWLNSFADNARYYWSGGDSLVGKKAIADYWKDRRGNVIDNIKFTQDIWLPLKVNQPQRGPDMPGIWLMNWYQVDVKYKNGKQLMFWVHTGYHYDKDNKIDQVVQYMDRAPIEKALSTK